MEVYIHIKSGNKYYKMYDAVDVTNSRLDTPVIVYRDYEGNIYVRETKEFNEKFEKLN